MLNKNILIGICGGSGSGKTTFAKKIIRRLGVPNCCLLSLDSYYKDQSSLSSFERDHLNYDSPSVIDFDSYIEHLKRLKRGQSINVPDYNYATHTVVGTKVLEPKEIIFTEGNLLFYYKASRVLMDIKVYIEVDADIRFIRRLQRDMTDRGRSLNSIIEQYLSSVKPMHDKYIEKSKKYASTVIYGGGENEYGIEKISKQINLKFNKLHLGD
jgi:uridine kinase